MEETLVLGMGRNVKIGDIYDSRNDTFLSNCNAFSDTKSFEIKRTILNEKELRLVNFNHEEDASNALNLDTDSNLNLLIGDFNIENNCQRFMAETVDKCSIKMGLFYKEHLEKSMIVLNELLVKFRTSLDMINRGTHFVAGIIRGFDIYFTIEYTDLKENQKKEACNFLLSQLVEIKKSILQNRAAVFYPNSNEWGNNLKICVYGDDSVKRQDFHPTSFVQIVEIIKMGTCPDENYQVVPISYITCKVKDLGKIAKKYFTPAIEIAKEVNYELGVWKVDKIYRELRVIVKSLDHLQDSFDSHVSGLAKETLIKYVQNFHNNLKLFQEELKLNLSSIRSGENSKSDILIKTFEKLYNSEISPRVVERFLEEQSRIQRPLKAIEVDCSDLLSEIKNDDEEGKPKSDRNSRSIESITTSTSDQKDSASKSQLETPIEEEEKEEINIILLGEMGVGKSTFINSFANYVTFNSLEEAKNSELVSIIPISFIIADEKFVERKIVFGQDSNEQVTEGLSKTQSCKSYVFKTNDKRIRLIDTPGIGDARGIAQDKINMESIIKYVNHYPKIHGICFLLKPNSLKLSEAFSSAIRELFNSLQKSASQNLVFVFTNARSTFYRLGDTFPVLKSTLEKLSREDNALHFQIKPETCFCMDNEAFRFLILIKNGVKFETDDVVSFEKSWEKSGSECQRLIKYISALQPHSTENTVVVQEVAKTLNLTNKQLFKEAAHKKQHAVQEEPKDIVFEPEKQLFKTTVHLDIDSNLNDVIDFTKENKVVEELQINDENNYVFYNGQPKAIKFKPIVLSQLILYCPGSLEGQCKSKPLKWNCYKCQGAIEIGAEDVYCQCGRIAAVQCGFKCSNAGHGTDFVSFVDEQQLFERLKMANQKPELNLLLVGPSGVGKSTFINALANYIVFDSLQEAESSKLVALIRTSFNIQEDYCEKRITFDSIFETGHDEPSLEQSQTQSCKTYVIRGKDATIRLIDTPGIGDTRGFIQDKKNSENILSFVSNYPVLHGILILLKPLESRLTSSFSFCITEILSHLHKSATENIVFLFTNARGTSFKPGLAMDPLRVLIKNICERDPKMVIKLKRETIYCFDNEPFRYLAATKQDPEYFQEEKPDMLISWNKSSLECKRLLNNVAMLKPHRVEDMLSVNEARRVIFMLSGPLATISQQIQLNQIIKAEQLEKIRGAQQDPKGLLRELNNISNSEIKPIRLTTPKRVCPAFSNRSGIKIEGECDNCGSSLKEHRLIRHESISVRQSRRSMSLNEDIIGKADVIISLLAKEKIALEKEQKVITETAARFAHFLKRTAIAPFNDSIDDYLVHLIEVDKQGYNSNHKELKVAENLQEIRQEYKIQKQILDDSFSVESDVNIQTGSIEDDVNVLYNLEFNGSIIKEMVEDYENAIRVEREEFSEFIFDPENF